MSRKFQIITLSITLLLGGLAVTWVTSLHEAIGVVEAFDTSQKFTSQTVGDFASAEQAYEDVTKRSGLSFPNGTEVEMYDDGWDTIQCCFTFTDEEFSTFIESFTEFPLTPGDRAITVFNLSQPNRGLPESACRLKPGDIEEFGRYLYADRLTNRIWLELSYTHPLDSAE